jgi:hypothetical protein
MAVLQLEYLTDGKVRHGLHYGVKSVAIIWG